MIDWASIISTCVYTGRSSHADKCGQPRCYVYVQQYDDQKNSKHVDFRYHIIRDYNKGIMKLNYISTKHSTADIMSKDLEKLEHRYFANKVFQDKEMTTN